MGQFMTPPVLSLDLIHRNPRLVIKPKSNDKTIRTLSLVSLLTLVTSVVGLTCARSTLEYPVMRFLNLLSRGCPLVDYQLCFLSRFNLSSGIAFMSVIWYAWFRSTKPDYRTRILVGTCGAALSGILSRLLQLTLPSHLRPLHTPELAFVLPAGLDPNSLNHWNSFPSDHAALLFGLATVIFLAKPRFGYLAFAWALILSMTRVYLGLHFPTDILGGGAVGVLTVSLLQGPTFRALGLRLLFFEQSATSIFYAIAFFLTLQIGTLFEEPRNLADSEVQMAKTLLHR
jgi:membrane-associated phospholipid phosphatase